MNGQLGGVSHNDFTAATYCSQEFLISLRISVAMYSKIFLKAPATVHPGEH